MDITWSKETISLLCCSMDGTVLFINFDNLEIGYPLNKQENEIFFKLKYSYDLNSIPIISNKRQEVEREEEEKKIINNLKFIENIEVLNLQEKEKEEKITFILSDSNSNSSQLKNEVNFPPFNSFLIFLLSIF
jgi:hypothetical protein